MLRTYLEACHTSLLKDFDRTAAAGTHSGDLGENREQLIVEFINNNQPRRLFASRGGQVIGTNSQPSNQIDILVTHDSTIEFRADQKSYRIVEATLAGVAVKSDLSLRSLKNDFINLTSIPEASPDVLRLSSAQHDGLFNIYTRAFPSRMIVGWNGSTPETLLDALNEVMQENPETPVRSYPDVVTVLKRGFSLQLIGKKEFLKGRLPRERVRWVVVAQEHGAAWPLCWLLNQLSAASGWASLFTVNLEPYWQA